MNNVGEQSDSTFGLEPVPGPSSPFLALVSGSRGSASPKRDFKYEEETAKRMLKALKDCPNIWQKVLTRKRIKTDSPEWEFIRQAANLPSVKVTKCYFEKIKKAIIRKIDVAVSKGTISKDQLEAERYAGLAKMYAKHPYPLWPEAEYFTKHIILHRVGAKTDEWSTDVMQMQDIKHDDDMASFPLNDGNHQSQQEHVQLNPSNWPDFLVPVSTSQPIIQQDPMASSTTVEATRRTDGGQHITSTQDEEPSVRMTVERIKIVPAEDQFQFDYAENTREFSVPIDVEVPFDDIKQEQTDTMGGEMANVTLARNIDTHGNCTPAFDNNSTFLTTLKEEPLDISSSPEENQMFDDESTNADATNIFHEAQAVLTQEEMENQLDVTQEFNRFIKEEVLRQPKDKILEFMRQLQYLSGRVTSVVEQEDDPEKIARIIESMKLFD